MNGPSTAGIVRRAIGAVLMLGAIYPAAMAWGAWHASRAFPIVWSIEGARIAREAADAATGYGTTAAVCLLVGLVLFASSLNRGWFA